MAAVARATRRSARAASVCTFHKAVERSQATAQNAARPPDAPRCPRAAAAAAATPTAAARRNHKHARSVHKRIRRLLGRAGRLSPLRIQCSSPTRAALLSGKRHGPTQRGCNQGRGFRGTGSSAPLGRGGSRVRVMISTSNSRRSNDVRGEQPSCALIPDSTRTNLTHATTRQPQRTLPRQLPHSWPTAH
jgi:hypothetical protein